MNGGATTSFGYLVELHPADYRGQAPVSAGRLYGTTRSDCAYGADLRWADARTLAVSYKQTQQIALPPSVIVAGRRIRLMAQGGRDNPDAPCGGMARR